MKNSKKLLLAALSATLAGTLTSGLAMTAFADEATKDHEFDTRNDIVFEDFDRADISNTTSTESGSDVNLGEKPYLSVTYSALSEDADTTTRNSQIYKQGSGSFAGLETSGGNIVITMRAPKGDVTLSELNLGIRGIDNEDAVYPIEFENLFILEDYDLTTEWQTFTISLSNSIEEDEVYPGSTSHVLGANSEVIKGIHIWADAGETGTLDIASVYLGTTALNDFTGGNDVQETAKYVDPGTWWAGSSTGYIVKRAVGMTGGSFTVVKNEAVGNYSYAVIETEGDAEHLNVATTTDGTTWSADAAFDTVGKSVALTGAETGFKFTYTGDASVTVKRIYLTNLTVRTPATAVPVIDASTAKVLENFEVAQSGFTSWENSDLSAPELAQAGMDYRISYANGDKVVIEDGMLVFKPQADMNPDYINYKFKSVTPANGKYVVFKMKGDEGANLDSFRFSFVYPDDSNGEVIWSHAFKAGIDFPAALLNSANPYHDADGWYYVVIDIEESGLGASETGYGGLDLYYGGAANLYIDDIFFCGKLGNIEETLTTDTTVTSEGTEDYAYGGYLYIPNQSGNGKTVSFDITPVADGFDPSELRMEIVGAGVFWGSTNAEGTLITTDGKTLAELTYTAGVATHVEIDLAASGIVGAFSDVHVHLSNIGAFTLDNVTLSTSVAPENAATEGAEASVKVNNVEFTAEAEGYQYVGGIDVAAAAYTKLKFNLIPADDNFDVSGIRLEFADTGATLWGSENTAGSLLTTDGKKLNELEYTAGQPTAVEIDLVASGLGAAFSTIHIHSNGTGTGSFTLSDVELSYYVPGENPHYAEQLDKLPDYLETVAPEVTITNATTATVGDTITVTWTASDNITPADELIVTVTVTKDNMPVELVDNTFVAEEGVYTITVTVRDNAGNIASDTIQIQVSAASTPGTGDGENEGGDGGNTGDNTGDNTEDPAGSGCAAGCGSMSIGGGMIGGGTVLLALGGLLFVAHVIRKKKGVQ